VASIHAETFINVPVEDAWAALSDWGALHTRLVPGFVVDTRQDGKDRLVTFFNGTVARERFVDRDDDARRLVWTVIESPLGYLHHNASAQAIAQDGGTRFVWVADILPHEVADTVRELMEHGVTVIKQTLESAARGSDR